MTLEKTLLQKLAEWRPVKDAAPLQITGAEGWSVSLSADRNEELATRVREVTLKRTEPVADLKGWAERICSRVTGLLEPLRLIELEAGGMAQLRSEAPSQRDGSIAYYEVLLHARGEAVVRRFQAHPQGKTRREQVSFALTHEVLVKFVGDLMASI